MAVEFALVFPLLFIMLFGTLIVGWRVWEHQAGQSTAREAARLASVGVYDLTAFRHDVVCFGEHNGLKAGTLTKLQLDFFNSRMDSATPTSADYGYVQVSLTYRSALGDVPLIGAGDGGFTTGGLYRVEQLGTALTSPQTVTVNGETCR